MGGEGENSPTKLPLSQDFQHPPKITLWDCGSIYLIRELVKRNMGNTKWKHLKIYEIYLSSVNTRHTHVKAIATCCCFGGFNVNVITVYQKNSFVYFYCK